MHSPTSPEYLPRRRLVVAGTATALVLIALVTYAVLVHRTDPSTSTPTHPRENSTELPPVDKVPVPTDLAGLHPTSDPATFARLVAEAMFAWDTTTLVTRASHLEQLVALGDPTGESTASLLSDLRNYLPTPDAWVELIKYETKQWLTIDTIATPADWAQALVQAGDHLQPGTTAFTVRGTRHRAGIWEGKPVATQHDVSFSIFMVCGPTYPLCHLLRLSLLNKPLD